MNELTIDNAGLRPSAQEAPWQADDLVEFPLLLTGFQATALESAARRRGLTPAQMLRQLIRQLDTPGSR